PIRLRRRGLACGIALRRSRLEGRRELGELAEQPAGTLLHARSEAGERRLDLAIDAVVECRATLLEAAGDRSKLLLDAVRHPLLKRLGLGSHAGHGRTNLRADRLAGQARAFHQAVGERSI